MKLLAAVALVISFLSVSHANATIGIVGRDGTMTYYPSVSIKNNQPGAISVSSSAQIRVIIDPNSTKSIALYYNNGETLAFNCRQQNGQGAYPIPTIFAKPNETYVIGGYDSNGKPLIVKQD